VLIGLLPGMDSPSELVCRYEEEATFMLSVPVAVVLVQRSMLAMLGVCSTADAERDSAGDYRRASYRSSPFLAIDRGMVDFKLCCMALGVLLDKLLQPHVLPVLWTLFLILAGLLLSFWDGLRSRRFAAEGIDCRARNAL